jgi:hypothetical protein
MLITTLKAADEILVRLRLRHSEEGEDHERSVNVEEGLHPQTVAIADSGLDLFQAQCVEREDRLADPGSAERAAIEVAEVEVGLVEGRAVEDSVFEVCLPQAGTREVRPPECCPGEVRLSHLAVLEVDTIKVKPREVDPTQVSTLEAVASP